MINNNCFKQYIIRFLKEKNISKNESLYIIKEYYNKRINSWFYNTLTEEYKILFNEVFELIQKRINILEKQHKKIIINDFICFLKSNECIDVFNARFDETWSNFMTFEEYCQRTKIYDFFASAFSWSEQNYIFSYNTYNFWLNLHNKWLEVLLNKIVGQNFNNF